MERAVKILDMRDRAQPNELNPQFEKAARKEVDVWKIVGVHPNCVRLHDSFCCADFCWMVMEKCNSGLLQTLVEID